MSDRTDDVEDADRRFRLLGGDVTGGDIEVDRSVEAGSPTLEHALFVLLGSLATVVVFLDGVGLL